jgi:hypothetical protein
MKPSQVKVLLDQLCVKLGFCLPPKEISRLVVAPPQRIDDFVDAVFSAEGVDTGHSRHLYRQVRDLVTEHFHRWEDEVSKEPIQPPQTTPRGCAPRRV